jgi:universal stress protein E
MLMKISNVLVIVDPTASSHPALDKASRIAKQCDARLELYACETRQSRDVRYAAHMASKPTESFVVNLRVMLEAMAQPLRSQGIDVCLEMDSGDPLHRKLLDRVARGSADLVIKDTHHHPLVKRTFITNTDWHLIRGCPVPLLLAKPNVWQQTPRVAAAIDPGHDYDRPLALDQRILSVAQSLARRLGADLQVLNALLPLVLTSQTVGAGVGAGLTDMRAIEEARLERLTELQRLVATFGVSMGDVHVSLGVPSQVLPALVQDLHVDILAMGAVSRSGLQRLFIGSTAEDLLESLPCDVLVVKAVNFDAALLL